MKQFIYFWQECDNIIQRICIVTVILSIVALIAWLIACIINPVLWHTL